MSQAGRLFGAPFLDAFRHQHILEPGEDSVWSISRITPTESPPLTMTTWHCGPVAGLQRDEMELRLMLSSMAELPIIAMHTLAFTCSQKVLRSTFRSFINVLQPQGEHKVLGLPDPREGVPQPWWELVLPVDLGLVLPLSWGLHLLQWPYSRSVHWDWFGGQSWLLILDHHPGEGLWFCCPFNCFLISFLYLNSQCYYWRPLLRCHICFFVKA